MKSPATKALESAIQSVADATAEIAALGQLANDSSMRRNSLECSCDLVDEKALAEITRLQVIEALMPRRIANREEALTKLESDLLNAAHGFIREHLGPRCRTLINRAKDKARAEFRSHFTDKAELEQVLEKSALVVELENLSYRAKVREQPPGQLVAYAQQLLRTWSECDALETKLT